MKRWRQSSRGAFLPCGGMFCLGLMTLQGVPGNAQTPGADKIAATVNGETIMEGEFYERLHRVRGQDFIVSLNPPALRNETAGQLVMETLVTERLMVQWATKTKQIPTDAEVNEEFENQKKLPTVVKALADKQITEERLRHNVRIQLIRFNLTTTAVSLSATEVEAYYKAHIANYSTPEKWGLAVLMTRKALDLPKIQADVKADKPFAEIVKTYSEHTATKDKGGALGVVAATDPKLPTPLRDAVKNLKVGDVTPPIKMEASQGPNKPKVTVWWMLRLMSKEAGTMQEFATIRKQVERTALLERAGGYQVVDKKMTEFRKTSKLVIAMPGYEKLFDTPPPKTEK